MKTRMKTLLLTTVVCMLMGSVAVAQGRGRGHSKGNPGRGHEKHKREEVRHDHYSHDRRDYDRDDHHYHDDRVVVVRHQHHHDAGCYHRPTRWVSVDYHYARPRYVYYRDYNVYFDCHREVYVWFNNGRWIVSASLPAPLIQVNLSRAVVMGVNYYDDDLGYYVERRRPAFFSVQASW